MVLETDGDKLNDRRKVVIRSDSYILHPSHLSFTILLIKKRNE